MRRRCTPGSHPDTFGERLRCHGTPGACGQFVLHDLPLSSVGAPGCADRMGWAPLDELPAGAIVLDLNDADIAAGIAGGLGIVTPAIGPALEITGAITAGQSTPWADRNGQAVTLSRFAVNASLRTAIGVSLDPADNQDIAVFALARIFDASTAYTFSAISGTRRFGGAGARGWLAGTYVGRQEWDVEGNSYVTSGVPGSFITFQHGLYSFFVARGGNQSIETNAVNVDTDVAPAGAIASGSRFSVGADPALIYDYGLGLARLVVVYLAGGLAQMTATWRQHLAACVLGHQAGYSLTPATPTTYARTSSRCCYPAGSAGCVHIVSIHAPPAEGSTGMGADEQIVSVTSKNHGFINGDGTTHLADRDAGLTITANPVDDTANLAAVFPNGNGLVLACQNPTGGPLVLRLGNAIGGAPEVSWCSVRARIAAGAGAPRFGWSTAGGAYTNVGNVAANYARSSGTGMPGAATDKQAIEIPAGVTLYLVLWCAGRLIGARVPDEVPSLAAAGVSSTVAMGTLTTTETPSSLQGSVEAYFTPRGWSGAGAGTPGFLYLTGGGGAVVYVTGGTWRAAVDGTTVMDSGIAPADGVEHHITLRWKTGVGMSMEVRLASTGALLARVDAAYDGSLAAAGTWQFANSGGPAMVRGLRTYRNG